MSEEAALLIAILNTIKASQDTAPLWNIHKVAEFFGRSAKVAAEWMAEKDAPKPVKFKNEKRGTDPLWFPSDVVEYARRIQKAA